MATRRRLAARSPAAKPEACAASCEGGRRPQDARRRRRERPCPRVDYIKLARGKPLRVGGDMLAVAADDGGGGRTSQPIGAGLEGRKNLLVHHQARFALR